MKAIVELISYALCFVIVPVVFFIYLFILLLFATAELLFYLFDRTEERRARLIKKLLFPLTKR